MMITLTTGMTVLATIVFRDRSIPTPLEYSTAKEPHSFLGMGFFCVMIPLSSRLGSIIYFSFSYFSVYLQNDEERPDERTTKEESSKEEVRERR